MRFTSVQTQFRTYPLLWFYVLSVLIVVLIIPAFILTGAGDAVDQAFIKTGLPFNTDLVTWFRLVADFPAAWLGALLALLQVASPDIAVFMVTSLGFGSQGLRELSLRFRLWGAHLSLRQGIGTWGICILTFMGMSLATAGLSQFIFPVEGFVWSIHLSSLPSLFSFGVGLFIAMFLDGGALFEENGWRGFALPLLLKHHSPLRASLVLGVMWACWHIPVKFDLALTYGWGNFGLMFAVLTAKFVLLTIVMTYFWNQVGQTTVIAIVMHGLSNDSVRLGGNVLSEAFKAQLQYELNLTLPLLVVACGLVITTRAQLGQGLPSGEITG